MFDLINGLPVHPLVVHAVVVLLPLAVVGTVALAVRPAWRVVYGPLLVLVTAAANLMIPVATSSGEALERHVGDPGRHAELGDQLIWFALPLLVLDVAMVWLARGRPTTVRAALHFSPQDVAADRTAATTGRLTSVVAVLAVVAALAAGVQVYRVGDSGARAAWADQVAPK
ncbi:DUF2231 domain-containing protein [Spongisporangium articulatum]|uniref:DUF2231 domain-containing protein n=1 Tax=Spongisporangium articulatum TaxID=3362603 RepID=A0ABW8ARU6_9ACTN